MKASIMVGNKDIIDIIDCPITWNGFSKSNFVKVNITKAITDCLEVDFKLISKLLPCEKEYCDYYFEDKLILRIGNNINSLNIQIIYMDERFRSASYYDKDYMIKLNDVEISIKSYNCPEINIFNLCIQIFLQGKLKNLDNNIIISRTTEHNLKIYSLIFIGLYYWATKWEGW